ncbi:MAG: hypothetical protein WAZ94_15290 [Phycisphaerales bacterium]|nr:hypothetical protein [Chloroflexota bacterium]
MPSFNWTLTITPATQGSATTSAGAEAGASASRDFAIDSATGDLLLVDGDLVMLAGVDGIASDLRSRLQTFAGEYFLDTNLGLPYFTEIFGKPKQVRLEEIFRAAILETPGVSGLEALRVEASGRTLSITFRATTDLGQLISASLQATPGGT